MRRKLVTREDIHRIMNKLQKEEPARLIHTGGGHPGTLFVMCIDYDLFVAELNDWCYRVEGGTTSD